MFAEGLNAPLLAALERPDLRIIAEGRHCRFDLSLRVAFWVGAAGEVVLGSASTDAGRLAFHFRHALELALLLDPSDDPEAAPIAPGRALLAAARVAARFWRLDCPLEADAAGWITTMASGEAPDAENLRRVAEELSPCLEGARPPDLSDLAAIRASWGVIGPVEQLLAEGGDARLCLGAESQLNHYGCSHRPRPWAVTYASSTASSLSERGFAGAEASRRRMLRGLLADRSDAPEDELGRVRASIARHYGLSPGIGIVLTASGTDCEMIALALAAAGADGRPVVNVLTAPDETGSGVPLASLGRHFADDTARGAAVRKGTLIEGLPGTTARADLAVRRADGTLLPAREIDDAASRIVGDAVASGRHVLLHYLDVSKTGLLAPSIDRVAQLARGHRGRVDVVVDACQARLTAARVRSYVEIGWTVLITGSKFFTGPPFCGALLVPAPIMARLEGATLPAGLGLYCGRGDWPDGLGAASAFPDAVNHGMALRWQAAIAEMDAFARVPASRKREIIERFTAAIASSIDASPDLVRVPAPKLRRPVLGDTQQGWDELVTIVPFLVLGRDGRPLGLDQARRLYQWLNADLTASLPVSLGATDRFLAALHCHVGQPAPVADGAGGLAGALRISAGARLVSGEPSHEGIGGDERVAREIADARACLDKLSLLLRHATLLDATEPRPSYGAPRRP